MKYSLDKYNLPPETAAEIENQVFTMLATGTNYPFDDTTYEDFASSVHNLADLSIPLGQEAVAVRSEVLREELAKLGISTPDGDFVYFGGRCVPTPTMFIAKETRPRVAEHAYTGFGKEAQRKASGNGHQACLRQLYYSSRWFAALPALSLRQRPRLAERRQRRGRSLKHTQKAKRAAHQQTNWRAAYLIV